MKKLTTGMMTLLMAVAMLCVAGCDPQVYGSVGVSSSFGSYGGYHGGGYYGGRGYGPGPRMQGSISVGGRIH